MNTRERSFTRASVWALLAAAVLGMGLVAYATRYGPGVGGDATIYLTTARNLLAGNGLGWVDADGSFRVLPYSPPFYPLALSAVGLLTPDLTAGARWLNVLLFGALVLGAGWFFSRWTGRPWLASLLALTLAASPVLLGVSVWAMSEPLFLLLGFGGLALLLVYFDGGKPAALVGSAALVGLAFLARYIGVAFVATAGLALLGFEFQKMRGEQGTGGGLGQVQWRRLFLYGGIALLPMIVWIAADVAMTGTLSSRSGQEASDWGRRFAEMGPALERIVLFWLLPESAVGRLPGIVRVGLWLVPLVALAAAVGWALRAKPAARAEMRPAPPAALRLVAVMGAFSVLYLVVLAVVQVFTYPPVTLAARMLSPVHLAVIVLLFALGSLVLSAVGRGGTLARLVPLVVWAAALGLAGSYVLRGALVARQYHRTGIGYTAPSWQNAPILKAVQALPRDVPLISNDVTALMYLAGRPAYTLQEIFQQKPQESFTVYGQGEDESQRVFREEGGALVLFNESLREDFAMYGERVEARLEALTRGLEVVYQGDDGAIYFAPR